MIKFTQHLIQSSDEIFLRVLILSNGEWPHWHSRTCYTNWLFTETNKVIDVEISVADVCFLKKWKGIKTGLHLFLSYDISLRMYIYKFTVFKLSFETPCIAYKYALL